MDVRFYAAQMSDGLILPRELPLTDVTGSGGFGSEPGTLTATLDPWASMRPGLTCSDSEAIAEATALAEYIVEGKHTIVAIREGLYGGLDGNGKPIYSDRIMGEWRIDKVPTSHRDPLIKITGTEVPGYLRDNVITESRHLRTVDSIVTAYELIVEGFTGVQLTHAKWAFSQLTTSLDATKGTTTYAALVADLQGTGWRWGVFPTLSADGRSVSRVLRYGVPHLDSDLTGVVLEATPLGRPTAGVLDWSSHVNAATHTQEVWVAGAGTGSGQKIVKTSRPRPAGMPRMSVAIQARDALTTEGLQREGKRALDQMAESERTITAEVAMSYLPTRGPQVGDTYTWISWPTVTKPTHEEGIVRVLGWQWESPRAGQLETATLTLERVS